MNEELDRQLSRAQNMLRRRAFGLSARVVLRSGFDEEGGGEWQESLCFGKLDGEWRLYLESGFADRPESVQTSELLAAHIDTRVLAAKKLPVLVQALEPIELGRHDNGDSLARDVSKFLERLSRSED